MNIIKDACMSKKVFKARGFFDETSNRGWAVDAESSGQIRIWFTNSFILVNKEDLWRVSLFLDDVKKAISAAFSLVNKRH